MIVVTDIASGDAIDRVTLDGDQLAYDTNAAQGMFDAKRPLGLDDAGIYQLMSDWSNGYVLCKAVPDGTG